MPLYFPCWGQLASACFWRFAGFAACLAGALALLRTGPDRYRLIAGRSLIAWVAVMLWIPFSRRRYVAPLLLPSLLLVGAMLAWAVERGRAGQCAHGGSGDRST